MSEPEALPTEPEAEAPEAPAAAPALEVEPGRVAVVSPEGKVQTVPREQFADATGQGYRAASQKEYDTAHTNIGDAIGAGVLGAGRGFVPGYDAGVIKLAGLMGADEEAARRELNYSKDTNPLASAGGEILGSLAQVYMMPGAATAEATAASTLGRAAQRAGAALPRAFAEGAAVGLQSRFSEDTLGNHELVGENYLAAGLKSGLLGAFLGAGFAAGGGRIADAISGVAGKGARGAERAGEVIERSGERLAGEVQRGGNELAKKAGDFTGKDIEKLAEREFGYSAEGLGERVRKKLVDWSAGFSGRDRKAIDELTALTPEGKEARRIVAFDSEKELEATMREFRKSGDDMLRSNKLTMEEFRGEMKTDKIAKAVKRGNEEAVAATTRKQIQDIIDVVDGELNHANGVAPQAVKSLESIARSAYLELGAVDDAIAKGAGTVNETAFIALDRIKRDVQAWVSGGYNGASRIADPFEKRLAQRSVETLDRTQNALRSTLEDSSLWGKAGDIQKAINADWTIQIDASKKFHQALTTEIGRDPTNPFMQMRGVDPAKADTYARGLLNPNADLTHKAVRDYVDSTERLAKTLRDNVDLPPAKMAEIERIIASAGKFRASIDRAEKTLALTNQYKALVERNSDGFAGLMGTLGLGVGGPVGGAVGLAAGTLANPGRAIAQMAALERMGAKLDERFGNGVKAFLEGGKKATAAADAASEGAQKLTTKAAETMVQTLRAATRSPAVVTARIAESLRDVQQVSPKVAQAAAVTMTRAAMHVNALLPPDKPQMGIAFGPPKPQPLRASEVERVRPALEVLQDPGVVADALARGQVSREHVRALAAIFPQRYARLQAQVRELGMQERPELSEQKLVALSILFNVPATAQMKPETIRGFQATFTAASKAQTAPGPKVPMKGQAASKASGFDRVEAS